MKSELNRDELAELALTSRGCIDQAVRRGHLDLTGSLPDVFDRVMLMRIKNLGVLRWADGLPTEDLPEGIRRGFGNEYSQEEN